MKLADKKNAVWLTFPVAGSAYRSLDTAKSLLTHSYHPETETVLCGSVKASSILDDYSWGDEGSTTSTPTCPLCQARLARIAAAKTKDQEKAAK